MAELYQVLKGLLKEHIQCKQQLHAARVEIEQRMKVIDDLMESDQRNACKIAEFKAQSEQLRAMHEVIYNSTNGLLVTVRKMEDNGARRLQIGSIVLGSLLTFLLAVVGYLISHYLGCIMLLP